MQCVEIIGNFWSSVQIASPLSFVMHYVAVISSIFLGLYVMRNTSKSLIGSFAASALILCGLALSAHFVTPYAGSVLLGAKLTSLTVVLVALAAMMTYFTTHITVLRHAPSKWLSIGVVAAFLPILLMIGLNQVVIGGAHYMCFEPLWGVGMYYVCGYILLLAMAHVYLFGYAWRHGVVKRIVSTELLIVVTSLLTVGVLSYVILGYYGVYSEYSMLGIYAGMIGLAYAALSDKRHGSGLVSSGILVPLVVIVLTSVILVDDANLARQMVIVAGALVLGVGYVLDRVMSQQAVYESLLRSKNDELVTLNKNKNEFLSFATHQLKAPLTSIKWGMGALRESKLKPDQDTIANQIIIVANQMVRTVSDFLNSAKLESGQLSLVCNDVDLHVMVQKIINEFLPIAQGKGLALKGEFPNSRVSAHLDEAKIEQVVANLVDNAIKYTPTGVVTVAVTIQSESVQVSIADTGAGMARGEAEKLFQKYQRGTASGLNSSGSGIGLYLGKQIVEMHGGKISATSKGKGKGSVFTIDLPLK